MSQDLEKFEALRKLLAVKRHEQPPPGYFDQMASEVMARLQAGEHNQPDLWKELGDEASWVQRLLAFFNAKPAMAGAFGMLVCGAMLAGLYFSQSPQVETPLASGPFAEKISSPLAFPQPDQKSMNLAGGNNASNGPVVNSLGGATVFDKIGIPGSSVPVSVGGN